MAIPTLPPEAPLSRPKKKDRRDRILGELRLSPHVRTVDLAARFGVSSETIRRDVEALEAEGRLARAHGGVTVLPGGRPDLAQRLTQSLPERECIGRHVANLIAPGETLMIDAGSTTLQFARHLAFRQTPVTVVTNGLAIALAIGRGGAARVLMCPGDYLHGEEAVVGPETLDFLGRHAVDRCVIGAAGVDNMGVSEAVPGFAAVKRTMIGRSGAAVLLVDAGKFGRRHLESVSGFGRFGMIVSDGAPPDEIRDAIVREGGRMVKAVGA